MPVASERFLRYERHCLRRGSSDRLKRVGKRPLIRYALREERKCGFDSHSADHIRPPRRSAAGDLICAQSISNFLICSKKYLRKYPFPELMPFTEKSTNGINRVLKKYRQHRFLCLFYVFLLLDYCDIKTHTSIIP